MKKGFYSCGADDHHKCMLIIDVETHGTNDFMVCTALQSVLRRIDFYNEKLTGEKVSYPMVECVKEKHEKEKK